MAVAPKISTLIPRQKYDIVRDRIGEILAAELANQTLIQTDPGLKSILEITKIYRERYHPFNESEMLAASLFFFDGSYSMSVPTYSRGEYTFYIDIFGRAATTSSNDGEYISSSNILFIGGLFRYIIESPQWINLGFEKGNPEGVVIEKAPKVISFKRSEEFNNRDAGNIMMYRLVFEVSTGETTVADQGLPLAGTDTDVTINETNLGYVYTYNAP